MLLNPLLFSFFQFISYCICTEEQDASPDEEEDEEDEDEDEDSVGLSFRVVKKYFILFNAFITSYAFCSDLYASSTTACDGGHTI